MHISPQDRPHRPTFIKSAAWVWLGAPSGAPTGTISCESVVLHAEVVLGVGKALVGSFAKPRRCLCNRPSCTTLNVKSRERGYSRKAYLEISALPRDQACLVSHDMPPPIADRLAPSVQLKMRPEETRPVEMDQMRRVIGNPDLGLPGNQSSVLRKGPAVWEST